MDRAHGNCWPVVLDLAVLAAQWTVVMTEQPTTAAGRALLVEPLFAHYDECGGGEWCDCQDRQADLREAILAIEAEAREEGYKKGHEDAHWNRAPEEATDEP